MTKLTKTLLIIGSVLLISGAIVLAIYQAVKPDKVTRKSLNEYIIEDFNSVADTLSEETSFFFYEVETVLNGEVDVLPIDSIYTESSTHFIHRDLVNNTREVETVKGHWGGCFEIESPEFTVTFEDALIALKESDLETPPHKIYDTSSSNRK